MRIGQLEYLGILLANHLSATICNCSIRLWSLLLELCKYASFYDDTELKGSYTNATQLCLLSSCTIVYDSDCVVMIVSGNVNLVAM